MNPFTLRDTGWALDNLLGMSRRAVAVLDADREPTPHPSSRTTSLIDRGPRAPFVYFAAPTPETIAIEAAIGAAYEEGRALYGDEEGDAWLAALEDGTHPLCRIRTASR